MSEKSPLDSEGKTESKPKPSNPYVYPSGGTRGLALRDYFAAQAMAVVSEAAVHSSIVLAADVLALNAYILADAMLAEREKPNE